MIDQWIITLRKRDSYLLTHPAVNDRWLVGPLRDLGGGVQRHPLASDPDWHAFFDGPYKEVSVERSLLHGYLYASFPTATVVDEIVFFHQTDFAVIKLAAS